MLLLATGAFAAALKQNEVLSKHSTTIEALKELTDAHGQFKYAIHTLIVPIGAVPNYKFPIPVARVRYEAVPLFDFDSSEPRADTKSILHDLAKRFKNDTSLARIAVVGHTNSIGTDAYNYDLSLRRALSIANILRIDGIAAEKITVVGLGESYPIATNETAEGRALNRRVEFFLSSVAEAIAPSIAGVPFNAKNRNNHDPACQNPAPSSTQECEQTSIQTFPTNNLTATGQLKPTREIITVQPHPRFPVKEIPEREHIPMTEKTRPHI